MDGSTVVIPSASPPAGLAREDALFRIVYYGEALRAMTEHVSDTLISGPCVPMIEMLDEAFDGMSETRDTFGPEEFTLFVMSKMLGLCEDDDEARQFQAGAAQYILKSADALPDEYQPVVEDARRMLRRTGPLAVTAEAPSRQPPTKPEPTPAEPPQSREERGADASVDAIAPAPPATSQPQKNAATPSQGQTANTRGARTTKPSPHTRGARMHLSPGGSRLSQVANSIERFVIFTFVAFCFAITAMLMLGLVNWSDLEGIGAQPRVIMTR